MTTKDYVVQLCFLRGFMTHSGGYCPYNIKVYITVSTTN